MIDVKPGDVLTVGEIKKNYNELLNDSIVYLTFCRDISLQKKMVDKLDQYVRYFKGYKLQANKDGHEDLANFFFGTHNFLNAIKSCIMSIIALKEDRPEDGWYRLIDAEEFYSWASKVNECLLDGFELSDYMEKMEDVLYPHFKIYSSLGFTTTKGDCSVCLKKIDECEHIEGKIYCGYACFEINKKFISIDHSAMVSNPEDRRCVTTKVSEGNKMLNYFTLKEERDLTEEEIEMCSKGQLFTEWNMINLKDLEIN